MNQELQKLYDNSFGKLNSAQLETLLYMKACVHNTQAYTYNLKICLIHLIGKSYIHVRDRETGGEGEGGREKRRRERARKKGREVGCVYSESNRILKI